MFCAFVWSSKEVGEGSMISYSDLPLVNIEFSLYIRKKKVGDGVQKVDELKASRLLDSSR